MKNEKLTSSKSLLFIAGLFSLLLLLKSFQNEFYMFLVHEDSVLEIAQALFYFVASIFAFSTARIFFKNRQSIHSLLYFLLSLGLFVITMEEISWGQRIFNFNNPEYFNEHNVQNEVSLHNLDSVQHLLMHFYVITSLYGMISGYLARKIFKNNEASLNFVSSLVTPNFTVAFSFFFGFIIYFLYSYVRGYSMLWFDYEVIEMTGFFSWRDEEVAETFISLGFVFFTWEQRKRNLLLFGKT